MKALIIYQDFASAVKANTALQNLTLPADTRVDWEVVPMRMEMLKFPPAATEALEAATDAHLVLFAGALSQSLPFWLLDWLQLWAAVRQVQDAIVAVTAGANGDAPALPVINALRQFAGQHGLSFIIGADTIHEPWIARRAQAGPGFEAYRHWGINE
ncbi:MAG TPA: hypothetical protein VNV43_12560 [Candidatus Acidoferrales bacterium]|jgi:hypothetical protein|nr:hypothetical protein [Candidatus Acidoferrales bacterium]